MGKTVIVTGAASGLGFVAAQRMAEERMAEEGANLVLVDLKEEALAEARGQMPEGANGVAVAADVSDPEQVKRYVRQALDAFGRIDGFFNNAGIEGKQNLTEDFGKGEFGKVIAVNLNGVFYGLAEVLRVMRAKVRERSSTPPPWVAFAVSVTRPAMPRASTASSA